MTTPLRRDALPHRDSAPPHEHVTQWAVGDASEDTFFLTRNPLRQDDLQVFVAGALMRPDEKGTANDYAFTPGQNRVVFTSAPGSGADICFRMTI